MATASAFDDDDGLQQKYLVSDDLLRARLENATRYLKALNARFVRGANRGEDALKRLLRKNDAWWNEQHPVWLTLATKLDDSDILYVLKSEYDPMLAWSYDLAASRMRFVEATIGDVVVYILGMYGDTQPFVLDSKLWKHSKKGVSERLKKKIVKKKKDVDSDVDNFLSLLDLAHDEYGKCASANENRRRACREAFDQSEIYFRVHRMTVKRAGSVLGVDMSDHDLTKTRLILLCLGIAWHWPSTSSHPRRDAFVEAVERGHLQMEDHHPQFEEAGKGVVNPVKLFVDRLSVHLQKEEADDRKGWGMAAGFIPAKYKNQWETFKRARGQTDLNEKVWNHVVGKCSANDLSVVYNQRTRR